jgi:hypothetical protein
MSKQFLVNDGLPSDEKKEDDIMGSSSKGTATQSKSGSWTKMDYFEWAIDRGGGRGEGGGAENSERSANCSGATGAREIQNHDLRY